jgi:hypothetical protein
MTYTIQLSTIGNKGKTKRIKKNPETTSTKEKKNTVERIHPHRKKENSFMNRFKNKLN